MISIAAVLLAIAVAVKLPSHKPIAVALVLCKLAELARPHTPPRVAMTLLLVLPALSIWSTVRALAWRKMGVPCAAAWAIAAGWLLLGNPAPVWASIWPVGLGVAVVLELAAWVRWRASGRVIGVTQRVAAALAAGDLGGFGVGVVVGWDAGPLAEGVAVVTAIVQAAWLIERIRFGAPRAPAAGPCGGGASAGGALPQRAEAPLDASGSARRSRQRTRAARPRS